MAQIRWHSQPANLIMCWLHTVTTSRLKVKAVIAQTVERIVDKISKIYEFKKN
jgi:hypothetical protein